MATLTAPTMPGPRCNGLETAAKDDRDMPSLLAHGVTALTGLVLLGLAACSVFSVRPPSSETDIPPTTSVSAAFDGHTITPATTIGLPPCGSGQVVVTAGPSMSASTHRAVPLMFRLSPGSSPCGLAGYPGVDSGAGGPLIHAERSPRGFLGGLPAEVEQLPAVPLWPSVQARAVVEGMATDGDGNQCPTYTDLLVTPPDTIQTLRVSATIDTCELQVHPVTGDLGL
jgi:Domain of unknown function (DUF4232)